MRLSNSESVQNESTAAASADDNAPECPSHPFRECELKLEGSPDALDAAFASLLQGQKAAPARTLLSMYFDTPGGALWAHGRSLRVRKAQGKYIQTLKWPDSGSRAADTRNEIETKSAGSEPDLSLFGPDIAGELEEMTGGAPLVHRFSAQMKRKIAPVSAGRTQIEAALDSGHIIDGDNQLPVRELELELKSGDPADLYEFAEQLSAVYNLRLGVLTKSQRGYLLAAGEAAPIRKAASPISAEDMRLDDLVASALTECADHFVMNWPALLQSDNPDAIHQMRVGIRRLRAMLAVFHRDIPNPRFQTLRGEAREIATALGLARDTDVFLAAIDEGPFATMPTDASIDAFRTGVEERREEGYGRAHAILAAPQTTRFVLELRAFVARRGWRDGLDADNLIGLGEPAVKFAVRTLDRLDRKARKLARKLGRRIGESPPEEIHRLRIVLKNIRYNAEMFGPLFSDRGSVKKFTRIVAHLQEVLGVYNDGAVSADIIADIERRADPVCARAAGIVLGWIARGMKDSAGRLHEDFRAFRKADRFWN